MPTTERNIDMNNASPARLSLKGKRFGRFIVVKDGPIIRSPAGKRYTAICKCDCGNTRTVNTASLKAGITMSCGCLQKELSRKRFMRHGHTNGGKHSPTYAAWHAMMGRCYRKKDRKYPDYGGRGIFVCDEWHKFDGFLKGMGVRPDGKTLGRKDHDKGYCPDNCEWQTWDEQAKCQRPTIRFYAWCL